MMKVNGIHVYAVYEKTEVPHYFMLSVQTVIFSY